MEQSRCRCAARWLSRKTRTREVMTTLHFTTRLPFTFYWGPYVSGRSGTLSVPNPLLSVKEPPSLAKISQRLLERAPRQPPRKRVRAGSQERPPPTRTSPPDSTLPTRLRSSRAGAAPRPRRAPRPASKRSAARPPPLIGGDRDGGGLGQRAADSRWRRPGGEVQPS